MIRVGIVADDLTGAGDTAVQFVRAGWTTELQLRPGPSAASVVAVTTDSRGLTECEAARSAGAAVKRLQEVGLSRLYKKIDSTLRGHVRAEVRAVLEAWSDNAVAVVCPAFPAQGRSVVDGELRVHGVPVASTAIATDPVTPVTESHIPTLLSAAHVSRKAGESPPQLAGRLDASGPVVVVDAESDADLHLLAGAVALLGPRVIPVGSAGLARHLALVLSLRRSDERPTPRAVSRTASGPVLVLVTSQNDVARRQTLTVVAGGGRLYQPSAEELIDEIKWELWSAQAADYIRQTDAPTTAAVLSAPTVRHVDLPSDLIPRRLAALAAHLVERRAVSGIVVTGGDGARAVVDRVHATGITLDGEVVAGVPIGTLAGGMADGLPLVTKAGGFGEDEVLLRAVDAIRSKTSE